MDGDEDDFGEVEDVGDFEPASDSGAGDDDEAGSDAADSDAESDGSDAGSEAGAEAPRSRALAMANAVYESVMLRGDARVLPEVMSELERAAVLAERAAQIAATGLCFAAAPYSTAEEGAAAELRERRCPLAIMRRVRVDDEARATYYEWWPVNELS